MSLKITGARTFASVFRTAVLGGTATAVAVTDAGTVEFVDALLFGAILGDYVTWLIRGLVTMPGHILNGCYEAVLNVAFGWFIFRFCRLQPPSDPQWAAVSFLAFMTMLGIKLILYGTAFIGQGADEGY
ncbi:MAG: hypothetical protein FJ225_10260 [Lentisphaerae bacterium]|nr:hypothetical protein [Lentisphaerota bacterium]